MTSGAIAGSGAAAGATAAAAAAAAHAVKASGAIVQLESPAFLDLVQRQEKPLIVHARAGFFSKHHRYLSSYKGLVFVCTADDPLELPSGAEKLESDKIWLP